MEYRKTHLEQMENLDKYKELGMDAYLKAKRRALANPTPQVEAEVQKEEEVKAEPKKKALKKSEDDSTDNWDFSNN
jgi:hypothetical protein